MRVDGRVSGVSQVSERARISIFWSVMNSAKAAGLSRCWVIEDAEQTLRWANWRVVVGPGLSSMSPASRRTRVGRMLVD